MAVQLVLRRPVPTPSPQLRVVWQGFREGDQAQAVWSDGGGIRRWPSSAARWIQRDGLRQGEEWKVNLPGVPADVHRIVLQIVSSLARTVGVAVQPLTGSMDDAVLHPGAELTANQPQDLLEFTRNGPGWLVTALNNAVLDGDEHLAAPAYSQPPVSQPPFSQPPVSQPPDFPPAGRHGAPEPVDTPADPPAWGWSGPVTDHPVDRPPVGQPPAGRSPVGPPPIGQPPTNQPPTNGPVGAPYQPASASYQPPSAQYQAAPPPPAPRPAPPTHQSDDFGPQVQIPTRLEPAVDAARASGNTRRRTVVGALVDVSASMRPWIASGQLADVLTAVQAVAGASNRPSVATRFLPTDQEVDLPLDTEPADLLRTQLTTNGLRTGDRAGMLAAAGRPAQRGGVQLLVTDDPSLANIDTAVVVLLGPNSGDAGFAPVGTSRAAAVVPVPPGPVDIRRLARDLANATAAV